MNILVLGKNGMLGQTLYEYLKRNKYNVDGTDIDSFDVCKDSLEEKYDLSKYDYVINCIGLLNHESNITKLIMINSLFPHRLDYLSKQFNFKLIHISTDCYLDNTAYGHSKWLGELKNSDNLTLRTSIIGYDKYKMGTGLFNWFVNQKQANGYLNHIWYGVTTLELSKVIEKTFNLELKGIIEVTNGKGISKYKLLKMINNIYNLKIKLNPVIKSKIVIKRLNKGHDFNIPSYKRMIIEMRRFYGSEFTNIKLR